MTLLSQDKRLVTFILNIFSLWFEYQKGQIGIQVELKVNIIMKKCQM